MIKLKELLPENRTSLIKKNEVLDFINTNCSIAFEKFKKGEKFYRGHYGHKTTDIFVFDPTKEQRYSRDSKNYYNMYMDTSPHWKGFPRRSWCCIFTSSRTIAGAYSSDVYVVLPLDNPKVAVSSVADFLEANIKIDGINSRVIDSSGTITINQFSRSIGYLIKKTPELLDDPGNLTFVNADTNPNEFQEAIKEVLSLIYNNQISEEDVVKLFNDVPARYFVLWYLFSFHKNNSNANLLALFYEMMTPKNTGTTYKNFKDINIGWTECWTEGKCLLINEDILESLIDDGEDQFIDKVNNTTVTRSNAL